MCCTVYRQKKVLHRASRAIRAAATLHSQSCSAATERAAVGSTPCCPLSADTGISTVALARPGLLAVTVIELAAAPLPAALCAVSTSIEASRARSAAVPVRCSVTWTMQRASPANAECQLAWFGSCAQQRQRLPMQSRRGGRAVAHVASVVAVVRRKHAAGARGDGERYICRGAADGHASAVDHGGPQHCGVVAVQDE